MHNTRYNANHSKAAKNTMKYNTNGWDTYRMFCFVEHFRIFGHQANAVIRKSLACDSFITYLKPTLRLSLL